MAFTVRSLLPKVRRFRDDLSEDECVYSIMETVRKVCRQTGYAQKTVSAATVASTPTVDLTTPMASYGNVYRIMLIRVLDTNMSTYRTLGEANQTNINNTDSYRDYTQGFPNSWAYLGENKIQVYPTPDAIYTLEVTASFIPGGEFDTIPLAEEAEECIVAGAISQITMIPGIGQNLGLSKDREVLYTRELDFLKANAILGQSGRARAYGGNFLGNTGTRSVYGGW